MRDFHLENMKETAYAIGRESLNLIVSEYISLLKSPSNDSDVAENTYIMSAERSQNAKSH